MDTETSKGQSSISGPLAAREQQQQHQQQQQEQE